MLSWNRLQGILIGGAGLVTAMALVIYQPAAKSVSPEGLEGHQESAQTCCSAEVIDQEAVAAEVAQRTKVTNRSEWLLPVTVE